jgi:vacuolar-type H+-ATPase subunit D/Vma8
MGKLEVTTTQTTEVVLSPKLRQALQNKLTLYKTLNEQKKVLKAKMDALTEELGLLRDEAEEMSVSLEGYGTVTLVAGTYKLFNKKRYVSLGGELAIYEQAMEDKPRKAYNKVTVAGASESDDE